MTKNRAFRALNYIGADLIERSEQPEPSEPSRRSRAGLWTKSVAIAACAAIVIGGGAYLAGHPYKEDSYSMEALKKLPVVYESTNDMIFPPVELTCEQSMNDFFNDESNEGFIAKIVPLEYTFYCTIVKDEDDGDYYYGGYAECRCSIEKTSQKYNLSKYSDEEIRVRQFIELQITNDEVLKEMLEYVNAIEKDESGVPTPLEGTYKVPEKFINEKDCRLLFHSATILLDKKPYYALIIFNNEIPELADFTCDDLNEHDDNIPDDYSLAMTNFKRFLEANDPELLD